MQLYEQAGMNLTRTAIWRDRHQIAGMLDEGELKRRLLAKG
jgi:hypothetical protein